MSHSPGIMQNPVDTAPSSDAEADATSVRPRVSVVIPSFNYGRYLADAVDSVLQQTLTDVEIIVVEGGSTDTTSRRVAASLDRPRTRVIFQGEPTRVGANRNRGIREARGTYVACLDADDRLRPTYLEKALYLLETYGYDVVSSAMQFFGTRDDVIDILEAPDLPRLLDGNHVLTCAVYRRELWEAVGGYIDGDASRGHVHEDWAFWIRLAAHGARFRNMARDPLLLYRAHGPSLSTGLDVLPLNEQRAEVRKLGVKTLDAAALSLSLWRARKTIRQEPPAHPSGALSGDYPGPAILVALPYLVLGGAEKLVSRILQQLEEEGWRIVIVTSITPSASMGDTTPWFEAFTPEIYHLPRFLRGSEWPTFLDYLVLSRRIDLLWIIGSAFAYGQLRQLRRRHPKLKVLDLLFNTVGHTANNRRWRSFIDGIVVENQAVRDWLLEHHEAESRIRVIESGVDLNRLRPRPRSPAVLEALSGSMPEVIIGFSGRWSEEKQPLVFVEIALRLKGLRNCAFVMTGTGPLKQDIEAAIAKAGFRRGQFTLAENVAEIEPWLGSMDLLVLPSRLDGRPVAVLEALALGVPILASRVGALAELVIDGDNGWLCEPTDIPDFVARAQTFISTPSLRQTMKLRARAFAEDHLDDRTMLQKYRTMLSDLIAL